MKRKISFFLFAGAIGFAVDMGVLWLMLYFKLLDPFSGRVLAIGAAMLCTYMINRTFTFGRSHRKVASASRQRCSTTLSIRGA